MSTATIDVDPGTYTGAGDVFLQVNDAVCDLVAAAATAAGEGGGMAGTDSGGVDWAAGYDDAAAAALETGATLADSIGHLGDLLNQTGDNHAGAEVSSVPGGPPVYPGDGATPGAVSVLPATPPSANGTDDNPPAGWFVVAHLLQFAWPNGHQDRLRAVATGWHDGAARLTEAADRLSRPIGDISMQRSPEVDAAVTTCCDVQRSARSLADTFTDLGTACSDYATHLDEAHSGVIDVLVSFAAETAGIQLLSAVAAPLTAGASELAGQAAQAARTTVAASRIGRILEKLVVVVRTVTATVRAVATRIREVLTKVRAVLEKGGAKAVEEAAPTVASDWPLLSNMLRLATREKGMFGMGSATRAQTEAMGRAWVGPDAKLASDGKTWVSADGLRQYRPPTWKPGEGKVQANFERREVPSGKWPHNGHVDVIG